MRVPVFTAAGDAVWEADLVSAFERKDHGIHVVRRCVDITDLLSAAAAGIARAVIVSADLRRLDRDALSRLAAAGIAVIGLVAPGDDGGERRLRQLGLRYVLSSDAGPSAVAAQVTAAIAGGVATGGVEPLTTGYAEPRAAFPDSDVSRNDPSAGTVVDPIPEGGGRLIAVWGPTGAPGRTTVAVTLATEAAGAGCPSLLTDADTYGGVVAQSLGLLDEAPGLAAAVRQANAGTLDVPALARLARFVTPDLRVLTGISRADRWPELRPAGLLAVYALARRLARLTVVDCGFCLEQDEELSYDTTAPRRNGATLATLADADHVVAVGSADPIGLQRLIRGLAELREVVPDAGVQVVVNRLRKGPVHGDARVQIAAALARYTAVNDVVFVPDDRPAFDHAAASGRAIGEVAADSPARLALLPLVASYAGLASSSTGSGVQRRAGGRRARRSGRRGVREQQPVRQ